MTGIFSEIDPRRCRHYARFFEKLNLKQANAIFWLLFAFVLFLMCVASLQHHKSIAITEGDKLLPKAVVNSSEHKIKNRRTRMKYLMWASLCLALSLSATVIECFALFNIEYCDGEDLMQLYWGFWSVLQVGSNIAILGVMVQFWIVLGDVETPSWAVALGTPVLVFAAIGFIFRAIWQEFLQKFSRKRNGQADDEENGETRDGSESDASDESGSDGNDGGERKEGRANRSLSTAPTIVHDASEKDRCPPPGPSGPRRPTPPRPAPAHRGSTNLWSRDLHYLLGSVVHYRPEERPQTSPRGSHNHSPHHRNAREVREPRSREDRGTRIFIVTPDPRGAQ